MTVDLGDLTGLGTALGLFDSGGAPRNGWFADPARYLKTMLTDDEQRQALLDTVDELIGGSESTQDDQGRTWLPVFEKSTLTCRRVYRRPGAGPRMCFYDLAPR